MKKKLITLAFALCVCALPVRSIVNGRTLTNTLKDLRTELKAEYDRRENEQQLFYDDYESQHRRMIDVITESNELSILLYTQVNDMTFDLAYALEKVSDDYKDFDKDRRPYDRIIIDLNFHIDRYARLIEALRRLPPMMKEIDVEIVPDSLLYHNDSLDLHISNTDSFLEKEVIRIAIKDTISAPFVLDEEGEEYRDTCIFYSSELLKMYADHRATVIADSTHYQEAYLRIRETYDYADARYQELEEYVFSEGQTPFMEILASPKRYWRQVVADLREQYDFHEIISDDDSGEAMTPDTFSSKGENSFLVIAFIIQISALAIFWLVVYIILWLIFRFVKQKRFDLKKRMFLLSVLIGTCLYFVLFGYMWQGDEYVQLGVKHINTFLWLLIALSGSLLLRVKQEQIRHGFMLYTPTILMAMVVIFCRITFIPDRLMIFLFPPVLFLIVLRQLFFCIIERGKATPVDSALGWVSLAIYVAAFVLSFLGFTFAALLNIVWWYFQLAVLLTIFCLSDLLARYKERWLDKRVNDMRSRITYVTGEDRESLLFGATWLYDLVRQVGIPAIILLSIPACVHLSLNVFNFNDLFVRLYNNPFVQLTDKNGFETLRISGRSIVVLAIMFFSMRYLSKAVHAVWRYAHYAAFMRKHKRTSIRANEINLSLGNSIITVLVWMTYATVVVAVWKVPTGSLGLVAGGLSAGIGIALKDIINNFIYGIQLMGGRLRVGDWIECDGVRGKVLSINYQCVQVETIDGTEMSFLNAALFGKNFNNLTRNNSYELTKIVVGVAYGTDVNRVREVLVEAMQQMRTKDKYGREIVDPKYGVYVVVENMSDSSVDIAVKQYVLVAERIAYVDRSKEVIYRALNAAGITIPFPQCDVHLIHDNGAPQTKPAL